MTRQELLSRISIDPEVCHGQACIRGTRIMVSIVLDFLAAGKSEEEALHDYPTLSREDIRAAIAYGAELSRGWYMNIPLPPGPEVQAG